ncbi:hypothetical protein PaecuDRAFT_2272 [Paenibacillus curdlanolyticus YK9]|uniref:Uncharacterized protein n=1 Tax=Paenibacillus curdlanolyticus YK9 TaxID=717606 RepID=E0I9D5_9BACL|nr:hypothetical protein PaecuDRAFT_2272 [Paenibacillus curdlanolyticus YK9]
MLIIFCMKYKQFWISNCLLNQAVHFRCWNIQILQRKKE